MEKEAAELIIEEAQKYLQDDVAQLGIAWNAPETTARSSTAIQRRGQSLRIAQASGRNSRTSGNKKKASGKKRSYKKSRKSRPTYSSILTPPETSSVREGTPRTSAIPGSTGHLGKDKGMAPDISASTATPEGTGHLDKDNNMAAKNPCRTNFPDSTEPLGNAQTTPVDMPSGTDISEITGHFHQVNIKTIDMEMPADGKQRTGVQVKMVQQPTENTRSNAVDPLAQGQRQGSSSTGTSKISQQAYHDNLDRKNVLKTEFYDPNETVTKTKELKSLTNSNIPQDFRKAEMASKKVLDKPEKKVAGSERTPEFRNQETNAPKTHCGDKESEEKELGSQGRRSQAMDILCSLTTKTKTKSSIPCTSKSTNQRRSSEIDDVFPVSQAKLPSKRPSPILQEEDESPKEKIPRRELHRDGDPCKRSCLDSMQRKESSLNEARSFSAQEESCSSAVLFDTSEDLVELKPKQGPTTSPELYSEPLEEHTERPGSDEKRSSEAFESEALGFSMSDSYLAQCGGFTQMNPVSTRGDY